MPESTWCLFLWVALILGVAKGVLDELRRR
jgi:hypothetical protein